MISKFLKIILQVLLLSVIAVIPFIKIDFLYFPFVSGKAYLFRLLVLLAFFFWIWLIIKIPKPKAQGSIIVFFLKNIAPLALILFFLAQIFVSFFGVSPTLSFFSTIERHDGVIQYGFWILYFLMVIFAFREKNDWKIFFSVFITAAVLVSLYAWLNLAEQPRLYGIFGNPSYLAAYLLFAIGFCAIVIERKLFEGGFINWIFASAFVFFVFTLFYTQTRGAYFALAAGIFLFCFLSVLFLRQQNKKISLYSFVVLIVGIIFALALFSLRETEFIKNRPLLSRVTEVVALQEVGAVRERILNWQIVIKAFKERPILGYGPENFGTAFNKYYDYRIGRGDPWFDRAHNQFIEPLATGGIVLFSFYLFFLISVFYDIFRISKTDKILSFILASIFLAYIIQGFFLFDTLPVYLGLFPFLAFVVFISRQQKQINTDEKTINANSAGAKRKEIYIKNPTLKDGFLLLAGIFCLFGIYTTVLVPYEANALALQFLAGARKGFYKEAKPFAEKSFSINSPYTFWELRKRIGWHFLGVLEQEKEFTEKEKADLQNLYDLIVPELEKFAKNNPYDPQIYYVLSRTYRLGFKKLDINNLEKARVLLEKAFKYSDLRVEYYNEMAQVVLLEGKFEEGEALLKDYLERVRSFPYFPYLFLGHYYYIAEKYDLAFENYKKAEEAGYNFCENKGEYSRYIESADKTKNYREIVDMSLRNIKENGPNADIYFNIALGHYYLGEREKAKNFFLKALELDEEKYQQYSPFF